MTSRRLYNVNNVTVSRVILNWILITSTVYANWLIVSSGEFPPPPIFSDPNSSEPTRHSLVSARFPDGCRSIWGHWPQIVRCPWDIRPAISGRAYYGLPMLFFRCPIYLIRQMVCGGERFPYLMWGQKKLCV